MSVLPEPVRSTRVRTPRLDTHVLTSGDPDGTPLLLVHGNVSSSRFWAELMAALPPSIRAVAPDLRSYGRSERAGIDGTRGLRDHADDLWALVDVLGLSRVHVVGWSVGGGIAMQLALDAAARIASITLSASMSPYGFGGTRGLEGTPCWPDHAGSGPGASNPAFQERLKMRDRGLDSPVSPRRLLREFYVHPGFAFPPGLEDAYVDAMLDTEVGDGGYPGLGATSPNWPGYRPGTTGMNNAISSRFCDLSGLAALERKPPVLWIRGAEDRLVSDLSWFEPGGQGKLGLLEGWPGDDVYPPQPMNGQLRAVLDRYAGGGGSVREEVLSPCGHSPHLEHPERYRELLLAHVRGAP